jgi:hypothetical protein
MSGVWTGAKPMAWARKSTTGKLTQIREINEGKTYNTKEDSVADFSIKLQQNPTGPYNHGGHRPSSLIWLETKNKFLAHFYTTNAKMNFGKW